MERVRRDREDAFTAFVDDIDRPEGVTPG